MILAQKAVTDFILSPGTKRQTPILSRDEIAKKIYASRCCYKYLHIGYFVIHTYIHTSNTPTSSLYARARDKIKITTQKENMA